MRKQFAEVFIAHCLLNIDMALSNSPDVVTIISILLPQYFSSAL